MHACSGWAPKCPALLFIPFAVLSLLQLLFPQACSELAGRAVILFNLCMVFAVCRGLSGRAAVKKHLAGMTKFTFPVYVMHGKQLSIFQNIAVRFVPQTSAAVLLEYSLFPVLCICLCAFESMLFGRLMPRLYRVVMGNRQTHYL